MASINVAELSDNELRKKIKELGKDAGPITKTTRPIWERKLTKLMAEQNGVAQEEPKKERRKSKGRPPAAAPPAPSAQKKTPSRTTAKGKKLAMFSSDEEPEEATLRSVQTSPIGFPSPTVVADKIEVKNKKTSSPIQNGKNLIAPSPASSIKITTRRKTMNKIESNDSDTNTATIESSFKSNISSRSRRNDDNQVLSSRSSKKLSEYSDDDFTDSGFKPKVYTNSNVLSSNNRLKTAEPEILSHQDDLLFKKPTALPSSSSSVYRLSTLTKTDLNSSSTKRSSSPIDKALLNPPKNKTESIASEIEATLDEIRKSYKAKKPSPLIESSRTVSHTSKIEKNFEKYEETEEKDEDGDMEDEEIDVKFAPTFGFMSKKVLFCSVFVVLLIALFLGLYDVGEKTDAKLGITQSLGNYVLFI